MRPPEFITLSQALSWLAFAERKDRRELNDALLTADPVPLPNDKAIRRCRDALDKLVTAAHDGKIELQGKQNETSERSSVATTVQIPTIALADFRAFDITTDGLRKGTGLLWLGSDRSRDIEQAKGRHYSEVTVKVTDLQKHLKPLFQAPRAARVASARLTKWYGNLSPAVRSQSIGKLWDLAKVAFPKNSVPRRAVEALCGPRQRGRPKNSP
jgi:hypothetical protein